MQATAQPTIKEQQKNPGKGKQELHIAETVKVSPAVQEVTLNEMFNLVAPLGVTKEQAETELNRGFQRAAARALKAKKLTITL